MSEALSIANDVGKAIEVLPIITSTIATHRAR